MPERGIRSLDAFLSHMWAVTMIGAPKKAAARAIEELEKDARGWYGGAIGMISLNGDINTGILIRTTYLRDGMATIRRARRCSTIPFPRMEERETRMKATAFSAPGGGTAARNRWKFAQAWRRCQADACRSRRLLHSYTRQLRPADRRGSGDLPFGFSSGVH